MVGIAHIKDLIGPVMGGEGDRPVSEFMRDATFIPDTKDILPLLSEMQTAHDQIVVVVDEYGGTAGIITIEDIVEEIVGEIEDEFDPDNKYLTRLSKREWLVDGRFPCDDAIELGWPIEESDEYETIAGWILDLCDSLPDIGEVFESDGYKFKVQSMRGQRISLIRVIAPLEGAQALRGGARRRRSVRGRARDPRARAGERHAFPFGARGREHLAGMISRPITSPSRAVGATRLRRGASRKASEPRWRPDAE
ncbi:MAG: transporter associated domain-containing protein [Collinsella sp.]